MVTSLEKQLKQTVYRVLIDTSQIATAALKVSRLLQMRLSTNTIGNVVVFEACKLVQLFS